MDSNTVPTGLLEIIGLETTTGLFITSEDQKKYSDMLARIAKHLEDSLDQNMLNYCDYVQFMDMYKIMTVGTKNKNYVTVCACSK